MLTSIVGSLLSSIDTKKGVPGISMSALDAIPDENTRLVLRSIVDGINVRNGASGEGTSAFVTKGEMTGLKSGGWFGGAGASATPTPTKITPGDINRIINDLQGQVMESLLFKELGERINLIDKPGGIFDRVGATELVLRNETTQRVDGDTAISRTVSTMGTRVGQAESAIQTETNQRVNAENAFQNTLNTQYSSFNYNLGLVQQSVTTNANNVSALSQVLNQIQAAVGNNSAAIQQEAQTRVNADGDIYAKYSVKIDVNGYVAGYGLMSTANNSTPFSEFIVRADRFAIGSPSGPGITPVIPFIVTTTTDAKGNAPGVYMDMAMIKKASIVSAFIGDAEITTAKIKDAAVETLTIKGNAVTVPNSKTAWTVFYGSGFNQNARINCVEIEINLDQPGWVYASTTGFIGYGQGWRHVETVLQIDGSFVSTGGGDSAWTNAVHSGSVYISSPRAVKAVLWFTADEGCRLYYPAIFIMGAKR